VLEGEVEIVAGGRVVDVAGAGSLVGEMALIDSEPRSATARAKGSARLAPLDQKRFLFLVQETPFFAIDVMRLMAHRLRHMNEGV
jgi:CRP-like cAMP-binding protein